MTSSGPAAGAPNVAGAAMSEPSTAIPAVPTATGSPPAAPLVQAAALTITIPPPTVTSFTVKNPLAAMSASSVTQATSSEKKHQQASSVRFADDADVEPAETGVANDGGGEDAGGGGGGASTLIAKGSSVDGGAELSASEPSDDGIPLESTSRASSQREREEWQLDVSQFEAARRDLNESRGRKRMLKLGGRNPVDGYYRQQNEMIDGFSEMDALSEQLLPPTPSEVREAQRLHRSEFTAVQVSNGANVCLFIVKIIASVVSGSLAIMASTLDSLLDLLCGFILWYTARAMRKKNPYKYPIGKRRMQPLGIIVFASIMASLGFQILLEGVRKLSDSNHESGLPEKWPVYVGIMCLVILTKAILFLYCRLFSDDIVQAYALDHMMDVVTNTVGLTAAVLAGEYAWWIDPVGAIGLALYTMFNWGRTVLENVRSLTGRTAPPAFLQKLTYLCWNHHREILAIDTVRAYTFGASYFTEVDVVLPEEMPLKEAHDIGEALQNKLERLPEIERAFVHLDYEVSHRPEHHHHLSTFNVPNAPSPSSFSGDPRSP